MDKKLRDYCLYDPVYTAHIVLIIGDREKAEKLFKEEYKEDFEISTDSDGYTYQHPQGATCIWLKRFNGSIDDYTSFIHEASHAANYILASRGVMFDAHNDEPYTYYLGFLIREFLLKIKGKE